MRVVDASVALKCFAEEPGADDAARVLLEDLVAPSFILGEVANGLWKKWRLKEVTREQALGSIANLKFMLDDIYPVEVLADRAAQIAFEVDHAVYDCFYIALAERLRSSVVTADKKLVNKLATTRYAALVAPLA